ncbi:hypothetical protein BOTBODRAFT_618295, partial [Botryobasidium botryosum FD-172 SS1]
IVVHGGAGYHSERLESVHAIKKALRRSVNYTKLSLQRCAAVDAVEEAICELEDDPCLNAGTGSNLNYDGDIECDASIMSGNGSHFGGVAAVSGVKNPIKIARALLENAKIPGPLGRVHPMTLVAQGAVKFAASVGIETVPPASMVSTEAQEIWRKWRARLEQAEGGHEVHEMLLQDTVGAVALDKQFNVSAGVSSGGILLKYPGRLGEAAAYGAGCWASSSGIACSVSGNGEQITRTLLAQKIVHQVELAADEADEIIRTILVHDFIRPCRDRGDIEPNAGVILLVNEHTDYGSTRLWCAFTTSSMAIAYASSSKTKPKALILRRPQNQNSKEPVFIAALPLHRD